MSKNKSILAISILITTLGITACQPKKTEPETVERRARRRRNSKALQTGRGY